MIHTDLDRSEAGEDPPERMVDRVERAAALRCHSPPSAGLIFATLLTLLAVTLLLGAEPGLGEKEEGDGPSIAAFSGEALTTLSFLDQDLAQVVRRVDVPIRRGLRYLDFQQRRIGTGAMSQKFAVAVTALGGMAFLGNGAEYKRGEHGGALVRAVEYLIGQQDQSGYITDGDEFPSKMHGHAYAVLFLTQVLGSIPEPVKERDVRRAVRLGVETIRSSQTSRGGWGYDPRKPERRRDEASITVCCLQALRAAKDAGIDVPVSTIRRAVGYLKLCCKPDGSFKYSLTRGSAGNRSTYELTAAAVSTLDAAGEYAIEQHRRGVSFLLRQLEEKKEKRLGPLDACGSYFYYGNLYAAQAFHQLGGEVWESWVRDAFPRLLQIQVEGTGAWKSDRFGDEYATAATLLILEIPLGYLPMFER